MSGITFVFVIMPNIKFIVAIIGMIICIRSKNRLLKVGTIFFMLYIIQFVYFWIKILVLDGLFKTNMISGEDIGKYMAIMNVPEVLLGIAAQATIIFGVIKENNIRNQQEKIDE